MWTSKDPNPWMSISLARPWILCPSGYTLQHGYGRSIPDCVKDWEFQGRRDRHYDEISGLGVATTVGDNNGHEDFMNGRLNSRNQMTDDGEWETISRHCGETFGGKISFSRFYYFDFA